MRRRMVQILAAHSGQTAERVAADIDRDYVLRGDEVVAYGLADEVISTRAITAATAQREAIGPTREYALSASAAGTAAGT